MSPRDLRDRLITSLALGCTLLACCVPAFALEPKRAGGSLEALEFFLPELYVSSANVPVEDALSQLPNQAAWEAYLGAAAGNGVRGFVDARSGVATNLMMAHPLIPGGGAGNRIKLADLSARLGRRVEAVDSRAVAELTSRFVADHKALLGVQPVELGPVRAVQVNEDLWQVSIPQQVGGVRVRDARLVVTISHGNVILAGTESWGPVDLRPIPAIDAAQAVEAGFAYVGGRSFGDVVVRQAALEILPAAPADFRLGDSPIGRGYDHRLAWSFVFQREGDAGAWEALVDAQTGDLIAFQDKNQHVNKSIVGGVYPITSTGVCPNAQTCGAMQSGWPMPFADTGFAAPNDYTNSGGVYNYTSGTAKTALSGRYVKISDKCGRISEASSNGSINMGGTNGDHDCTRPAGASRGDTAASRTAFYEVNKLAEMARGWLPANTWLQAQLTSNVNINNTCNAFWSTTQGTINFYRSGGGCRNTGELAGVFDHEWGHGLDDNDAGGALSNSSEGYADIAAIYRLQASCVGHGFFDTSVAGSCGLTLDGTGRNADEDQTAGLHCNTDCSGVRDADWNKHADQTPDTPQNHVCVRCNSGTGPCGAQVHCAAAPARQAAWDLAARDLPAAGYSSETSFIIANKLFFQGSGSIGSWHACNCGAGTSDGCGATNGYMQWLAADDDNGSLADGTPHMTAIHAAYNRHNIACGAPTPTNGGCGGGPSGSATLTATPGSYSAALSWTSVPGATRYWVFRTEGHAGCNFGKALIAEVTGLSYTDTQVLAGRGYSYNVVAAGASSACFAPASNCAGVTPNP